MPTYEYECTASKHRFEQFQKFSDPPVDTCPECGSSVRRVIFPAGIVFKGSGWYITDSRKSPPGDVAPSDTKTETKTEAKSDGKAATKEGAAKSEPSSSSKSETPSTAAPAPRKTSTAAKTP